MDPYTEIHAVRTGVFRLDITVLSPQILILTPISLVLRTVFLWIKMQVFCAVLLQHQLYVDLPACAVLIEIDDRLTNCCMV